tara:strand:- start:5897 stop:7177 length:1281 start_codon:yes stop_codon:yes gene_type:complete
LSGKAFRLVRHLFFGLAFLWFSAKGHAVDEVNINLAKALELTLAENHELLAYPFSRTRQEALKLQAGISPSPNVQFTVENALGSGDFDGVDSAESTLALSQLIELGDKRKKRMAFADARLQEQEFEFELARLDVLAETSRRYYRLLELQALQALTEQQVAQAERSLAVISTRAEAGAVGMADASKLDLRLAQFLAHRQQLVAEHAVARTRLAAMWQGDAMFSTARGNFEALPVLPRLATVLQTVEEAPATMRQAALQRMGDARLQLARANGRSDLIAEVGLRRLEASNDNALVFSINMPLTFSNPNRGRIAAARAEVELGARQSEWTRRQLELGLTEIHQRLSGYTGRAAMLQRELLPRAEKLVEDTSAGYQLGRYSVLQWTDAQAERFSLEKELIEMRSAIHLLLLELERITGAAMTGDGLGENS